MENVEIYISVSGGNVQEVRSNNPNVKVNVIDWDNMVMDDDEMVRGKTLNEKAQQVHQIY
jgi:hypothetical protein